MIAIRKRLAVLRAASVIDGLDTHVAQRLCRRGGILDPEVATAFALAIRAPRHGHICVDLAQVDPAQLRPPEADGELPDLPGDRTAWVQAVAQCPLVRTQPETGRLPFHLEGTRLYTDRYWSYQVQVANRLSALAARPLRSPNDPELLESALPHLFGSGEESGTALNRQLLAGAVAMLRDLTVITGGPGMGKTWTVRNILALALLDHPSDAPPLQVALAAPSGKAAVRMREALSENLMESLVPALDKIIGQEGARSVAGRIVRMEATTLHRLLGWQPASPTRFRHHRDRPLAHDLVVVDECSMIDLAMMAKLLDAIGPRTRLILLGDPHQLASVEAGTVLADICELGGRAQPICSPALSEALRTHAGIDLTGHAAPADRPSLQDAIVRFDKNHRFTSESKIGRFASACLTQPMDVAAAIELMDTSTPTADSELVRMDHTDGALSASALQHIQSAYTPYLRSLSAGAANRDTQLHHRSLLDALEQHRVLCAHRKGTLGTEQINRQLTELLGPKESARQRHWPGQPIIVLKNDPAVGRSNGDVGMVVQRDGELIAAFPGPDTPPTGPAAEAGHLNLVEYLSLARLPAHETCFAMTIHKSQGSQWPNITVVLPDQNSPILTRELIYTAITRARRGAVVLSSADVLSHTLTTRIHRASGLPMALGVQASQCAL